MTTREDVGVFSEAATERWENAHGREPDDDQPTLAELYLCDDCGGTGWVTVPCPRHLSCSGCDACDRRCRSCDAGRRA